MQRCEWSGRDALELDPTRAHNQLCLINDFRGVPGAPDLGNVAWLEMEDRWIAEDHHSAALASWAFQGVVLFCRKHRP